MFEWVFILAVPALQAAQPPAAPTPPPPQPPRFDGSAEFSYVGTGGNSTTQTLGSGVVTRIRLDGWTITSKAAYVRNKDRDTMRAQSTSFSTEAGRLVRSRLSVVARYGYFRDRFAGIRHRHTTDGGLALDAIANSRHVLKARATAGYAEERRLTGPELSTAIATTGMTYALRISDTATFEEDAAAEFSLQNSRDQRVQNTAAVTARLNSTFSLKVKHTMRWVKSPAPGFRKMDTVTAVALVAKF